MTLLDTCIVIDLLRGREAALKLVDGLPEPPALSVIAAPSSWRAYAGNESAA